MSRFHCVSSDVITNFLHSESFYVVVAVFCLGCMLVNTIGNITAKKTEEIPAKLFCDISLQRFRRGLCVPRINMSKVFASHNDIYCSLVTYFSLLQI